MKWNIFVGSLVLGLGLSTQSFGLDLLDRMLGMNYNGCSDTASCCDTKCDPGPSCGCDTGCDACVPCAPKCRRTPLLNLLRNLKCRCQKAGCDGGCSDASCADPGCDADPACGCEAACDPGCGAEPACGCEAKCVVKKCRRTPLLNLLRSFKCKCKKSCCDKGCADPCCGAEPACGCEAACDPGCGAEPACGCEAKCVVKKRCRTSLLDRIFGKHCARKNCCDNGCADPCCGAEPSCGCDPVCGCEAAAPSTEAKEAAPTEAEQDEVGPAPVVDPSAFLPTQRRFIQTNLVR